MKLSAIAAALVVFTALLTGSAEAETSVVSEGIKAILKIDEKNSIVDLRLSLADTQMPITGAKVVAAVTLPGGKKTEKELMEMKMGDGFSYMNTLDMKAKGVYIFDITVTDGKKKAKFSFSYGVK